MSDQRTKVYRCPVVPGKVGTVCVLREGHLGSHVFRHESDAVGETCPTAGKVRATLAIPSAPEFYSSARISLREMCMSADTEGVVVLSGVSIPRLVVESPPDTPASCLSVELLARAVIVFPVER